MALFQAFRAVRPAEGKAEKVAALPYDVVSREEAREIGEKNPYSFLHVDRAEMDLDPGIDLYDAKVYRKAKENLDRFQAEGTLIQDEKPNYYLYELMENWKNSHEPVYDFTSEDEITHRVWIVDEEEKIQKINRLFGEISSIYIADGHHRAASAVKVGQKRRKEHPDYTGKEEFNFFLSVVFPYDQLTILPYHRIVKDLKGMEPKAFIGSMKFNFELMAMPGFPCKPVEKHCFGLHVDGEWFHLKAYPDIYAKKDSVGQLDVSILQDKVLGPVLGIEDPRTDERICFMGGNHRLKDLAAVADETGGAAFAMYPTSMEELMNIADEGKLMPPKSTWFEPKLRSGLFIHKLSD